MASEAQSPPRWADGPFLGSAILMASMVLGVALAIAGTNSRFLATDLGATLITISALIFALLVAGLSWRAFGAKGRGEKAKVMLAVAILSFGAFWVAAGDMTIFACWYTNLVGIRTSMTVTAIGQASVGRYGCHRLEIADQHWVDGGRTFCASLQDASRIPIGQKIVLSGRLSPLGLDADPVDLSRYQSGR